MRLLDPPLFAALFAAARGAQIPNVPDCQNPKETGNEKECAQRIADVTAIRPGSSYIAKLECKDCPYVQPKGEKVVNSDHLLLLNVTLTHDNRTVLLNNEPLYPLPTIPTPPHFSAAEYSTNLSYADLYYGLSVSDPYCMSGPYSNKGSSEWCLGIPLSPTVRPRLDYLYIANPAKYDGDDKKDDAKYWEISLDVIGRTRLEDEPLWRFDKPEQKMLWILVKGTPLKARKSNGGAADPFNGQSDTDDTRYEYQIIDIRPAARAYTFPAEKSLSFWGRIGHFFGNDVWEVEGHRLLFHGIEWGQYGKKGTLRNLFGEFVHWDFWPLFWIILVSVIGGLFALFGVQKLFKWIVAQRELMKWDGMEDVWENMRRERIAEEEGMLLHGQGRYTDDPEEGGSSSQPPAYEDAMKPLPSKPLPEKPLPEVPLIDA